MDTEERGCSSSSSASSLKRKFSEDSCDDVDWEFDNPSGDEVEEDFEDGDDGSEDGPEDGEDLIEEGFEDEVEPAETVVETPWYIQDTKMLLSMYGRVSELPPREATADELEKVLELEYEVWRPIPRHPNYLISTFGRCYSKSHKKLKSMKARPLDGYVDLKLESKKIGRKPKHMHAVVGKIFLPSAKPGEVLIDHINGIRNDNHIKNLRWASYSTNSTNRRAAKNLLRHPILQHLPDGKTKTWPTLKEVAAFTKVDRGTISRNYIGTNKILGGSCWTYVHEDSESIDWRAIPVAPNLLACFEGNIKFPDGRITSGGKKGGYLSVKHRVNGKYAYYRVNRLICSAFNDIPERLSQIPLEDLVVNHRDGNKQNNVASNLEWASRSENAKHAYATGLADQSHTKEVVIKMDLQGNQLEEYESMTVASEKNPTVSIAAISAVCSGRRVNAGGFQWKKARLENVIDRAPKTREPNRSVRYPNHIVKQYDIKGKLIATYETAEDAAKAIGVPTPNIHAACSIANQRAGGFFFRRVPKPVQ
jgi:hypothetical protein